MPYPQTLQEAIKYFSDELTCIQAVAEMRWPDGKVACAWCGSEDNYWLANQKRWKCKACTRQFSAKRGTIFTDSPLGLDKWLVAMWMLANCRNGVSSYEIARTIGITQKSAWHMMHRIRKAMTPINPNKLGGEGTQVEADETYIGGKARNKHHPHKVPVFGTPDNKTIVMGTLDREKRKVRAQVIKAATRETMEGVIHKNVKFGSVMHTDNHVGYDKLKFRYAHEVVNHVNEYVRGNVHTNGIENFWSLLKRGLGGTYISVDPEHLERYVHEQVFRFNHRYENKVPMRDAERFKAVLKDVTARRLTYAELTGKTATASF